MFTKFSQQLKDQLANYFKVKYKIEITSEQADEYLDSLADLALTIELNQKTSLHQSQLKNNTP